MSSKSELQDRCVTSICTGWPVEFRHLERDAEGRLVFARVWEVDAQGAAESALGEIAVPDDWQTDQDAGDLAHAERRWQPRLFDLEDQEHDR